MRSSGHNFSGGVRIDQKEYLVIKAGPCRDVRVHILVAEAKLGRKLRKNEHVHHKDGNTRNPHWTNLLVINDGLHGIVSNKQRWYLKQKFNREEAAWHAFFDATGKTYDEYESTYEVDTSFDTEKLDAAQ